MLRRSSSSSVIADVLDRIEKTGACTASADSYAWLLRQCDGSKAIAEGKRVHACIIRNGLQHDTFLSNLLVRMYANCGKLADACQVFASIRNRNIFSYNIMIAAYARYGQLYDAKCLFEQAAGKTSVTWTTMITAFAQNGHLFEAKQIFDRMSCKDDVVLWNAMITACSQNNHGEAALEIFQTMDLEGVKPDTVSFVGVIDACANISALEVATTIHADTEQLGYVSDVAVGTALVNMYGKCKRLSSAKCVFDSMPDINVVSWTAMIAAYGQSGYLQEAKSLFDELPTGNIITWNTMLSAYARNGQLEDAKDIFDCMEHKNVGSWNLMMVTYVKFGYVHEARSLFNQMPDRDVVSWNGMIGGYAQNSYGWKAFELFRLMDLEGMRVNRITFLSILDACGILGDISLVKDIRKLLVEAGLLLDIIIVTALVNVFAKCRSLEDAKAMFDTIKHHDLTLLNSMLVAYVQNECLDDAEKFFAKMPEKNVVSWNVIASAYAQHGYVKKAMKVFEDMHDRDIVSWNMLIAVYVQSQIYDKAALTFHNMSERNAVSWNNMLAAYVHNKQYKEAFQIFQSMDIEGIQMNSYSFVSVLEACAGLASQRVSHLIHDIITEAGFEFNFLVATGIVSLYGKCGNLEEARGVFDRMLQRSTVSWNAMLTAYAQNGLNCKAISNFYIMQLEGMQPDEVTFITMLCACSQGGLFCHSHRQFISMKEDYGIQPTLDHYVCMIDTLGRAGQTWAAEDLISNMPFKPDEVAWTTYVAGCDMHGDAARAVHHVLKVDRSRESGLYMLLSKLCLKLGDS